MKKLILPPNHFLDEYLLNAQFHRLAGISKNAFKFWRGVEVGSFAGSRIIFLKRSCILKKHAPAAAACADLAGLVLASAFCAFTGLASSHLVAGNNSNIYKIIRVKEIAGVKFVDLRGFYDFLGLDYSLNLYIEKCHFFSPEPLERRIRLTSSMCVGYY